MIPRYNRPEIEKIWSLENKFNIWTNIECLIAEKQAEGIYHLSGKDNLSILDLVYAVADFYGHDKSNITPISSVSLNQTAKRPPKTGFILDKAINDLEYSPCTFKEGLAIITEQLKS